MNIRKGIAYRTIELLEQWDPETPFVVHAKTEQGTGKTTGVMDTVGVRGHTAAFGPRHDDIDEDADRFNNRYEVHFAGKDNACENEKYKGKHSAASQSASQDWCEGCSERDGCEYFTPFEQLREEVQDLTAPYNYLEHFPEILDQWPAIEIVVIDETPWDTVFEKTVEIEGKDLTHTRSALREVEQAGEINSKIIESAREILDAIETALTQRQNRTAAENAFRTAVDAPLSELRSSLTEINDDRLLDGIRYSDSIVAISDHIQDVGRTQSWATESDLIEETEVPPAQLWGVDTESRGNPTFTLRWKNTELKQIAREKPVFVLATEMPTESVRAMFDLPVVTIEDTVTAEVELKQLKTRGAGITRLRKRNQTYENLLEFTELALRREWADGRTTLIAVKKELLDDVKDHLDKQGYTEGREYKIGNYYAMTGSNRFEDCEAFIGFGVPGLSDTTTRTTEIVSGVQQETIAKEGREGELRDAIHRIRPVHMEQRPRVYLFTNAVDYTDDFAGPNDQFTTSEFRSTLKQDAKAAERQRAILDRIRESEDNLGTTELVENLSISHSIVTSELRHLRKEGIIESYRAEPEGRGQPPKLHQIVDAE